MKKKENKTPKRTHPRKYPKKVVDEIITLIGGAKL